MRRERRYECLVSACAALTLAVVATGCGDDQDPGGAQDLFDRIQAEGYQGWAKAPGFEAPTPSSAPHGNEVVIYLNDVMVEALSTEGLGAWPEGALIVKDGFDDGELDLIAAMEKRSGEWYWAEWDGEGESIYSGKPRSAPTATCPGRITCVRLGSRESRDGPWSTRPRRKRMSVHRIRMRGACGF
jgi:hypothetical protein